MKIKLISKDMMKPNYQFPKKFGVLQASLFDHVNSSTLMPIILFFTFPKTITGNNTITTKQILIRLKQSLPITLSLFYPLAGRIGDADHVICNDQGVPYIEAVVDELLENIIHKADVSQLDKLLPPYGQQGFTTLLLAIQVNVFMCGGIAIGVKMNHFISDAFSIFMFVKTWASIANTNKQYKNYYFPFFEIYKLFPPSPSMQVNQKKSPINPDDKLLFATDNDISLPVANNKYVYRNQNTDLIKERPVTKWFMFEEAKLDALRTKLFSKQKSTNNVPSLALVLSAFIWTKFKKNCYINDNNKGHQVFQAVNIRDRVSPPDEQSYYFGNMFVNAISNLSCTFDICDESLRMVEFIQEMKKCIKRIKEDETLIRKMQDGREDLSYVMDHFERESKGEIVSLGFSNLSSLPVYEADFGWGKPVWVTSATLMYKHLVIIIPAGPTNKDIIAYVNLTPEEMVKLESDLEFVSFVSNKPHLRCKF